MEFWQLSHLEADKISTILVSPLQQPSTLSDKQKLAEDKELLFSIVSLIGENKKYPWICQDKEFMHSCLSLYLTAGLHEKEKGCILPEGLGFEEVYFLLDGQFHYMEKDLTKEKKQKMRPQIVQSILKEKHIYPIFTNKSQLFVNKNSIFLSIPLQNVFYLKRQARQLYNARLCKKLSEKMIIQEETIHKFGMSHKIEYHQLKMREKLQGNAVPGLIMIKEGQILCSNEQGQSFLVEAGELLTLYDGFNFLDDSCSIKATKNTIYLSLKKDILAEFIRCYPEKTYKFSKFCAKVSKQRSQFFKEALKIKSKKLTEQMLLQFQNLTSSAKQKRRFSRYHRKDKDNHSFDPKDFIFVYVLVSNRIVESRQKVRVIKKDKDDGEDKYQKVFQYFKSKGQNAKTNGLRGKCFTKNINGGKQKKKLVRERKDRYSTMSTKNIHSKIQSNQTSRVKMFQSNLVRNSSAETTSRTKSHTRCTGKQSELQTQNTSQFTICRTLKNDVSLKQNNFYKDSWILDSDREQNFVKNKNEKFLTKHKIFTRNKYGRVVLRRV